MKKINVLLFFLIVSISGFAKNIEENECTDDSSLAVIYLNGVGNTEDKDVKDSKENILRIIKNKTKLGSLEVKNLCLGHVYNQTIGIKAPGDGYIPLGDFVETAVQKIEEEKLKLNLGLNWEHVAKFIATKDVKYIAEGLAEETVNSIQNFIYTIYAFSHDAKYQKETEERITKNVKKFVVYSNKGQVKERPAIVVSHSQGNLFFNTLYRNLKEENLLSEDYLITEFANLQVGTAALNSDAIVNEHYTAVDDLIIQKVLNLGFQVREPNLYVLYGSKDKSNHAFVDTYSNSTVATFDKSISDKYKQSGVLDLDKIQTTEDIFYEKLNKLAEKVLNPVEPVQLNLTTACTNDSKIEFHLKTSDNFTFIELGTFVQTANLSGGNRSVLTTYKNASEIPNVHYNETRKEYSFDYSLSNRSADTYFYVKACSSETLCQEEVTYIGRPEFDESNINSDGKLESVSVISHPDLNVTESSHRIKFEAAGERAISIDNPAHYVGCSVRTKELLPDGRVIQGVFVNYTTPELGVPAWYEVTSAVNTFEVDFSYNTLSCEDRTKFDGRSFEIVEPACEAEFEAARLYNANN